MPTHNPNNERIKRQYFAYLKEAKRYSETTVDAVAKSLSRFEADTKLRDFKTFHFEQAVAFKNRLAAQESQASGKKLSKATLHATLFHLKRFFIWLAGQPGYRSGLRYSERLGCAGPGARRRSRNRAALRLVDGHALRRWRSQAPAQRR